LSLRIALLGIIWFLAMVFLFTTPITSDCSLFFNAIPARAIVHFFLFWGFTHIWIGAFKKQLKFESLRKNAIVLVFGIACLIALISELLIYLVGSSSGFGFWNIAFDVLGAMIGVISFRLLYATCY